jgi:hypothetical protein
VRFSVSLSGVFEPQIEPTRAEELLDSVMEEMLSLGAHDASIEASLGERQVAIFVRVEAPNPIDAIGEASVVIRSAIHAAGGGTPDWPKALDKAWGIQLENVSSDVLVDA